MKKRVAILGSTGSIGTQALEVIEKLSEIFEVTALTAGCNISLLTEQIQKYSPSYVSVQKEEDAQNLRRKFPEIKIYSGEDGLISISELEEVDMILVSVSGKTGLKPVINAIKHKKEIALANKETLVMAGDIVMSLAKENNVKIIPVDSEHSAIFQCLENKNNPKFIIITASGGPFRNSSIEEIESCTIKDVLNHPRWNMGKKITVDSATLMNKGLEVIEAHHLFNIDYDNIKTVIHPQSYMHGAVEFEDGSIIAQIGVPSMHIPIQYALTYPERFEGIKTESFDFVKAGKLEFYEPDYKKFPALKLAIEAGKKGGTATVCLNAANEEAVFAFLGGKIKFTDIYKITEEVYNSYTSTENPSIDVILEEDEKVRTLTRNLIKENL